MNVRRIVSVPMWDQREPREGELHLRINAGRGDDIVFGFGSHDTTKMCLGIIGGLYAEKAPRPRRVLDVGCGTGVLSIACARLGAGQALGIDISPASPPLALENAERNQVADRCRFETTPLAEVTGAYDLVMANLPGSRVVLDLAEQICARAAPDGLILLSGFPHRLGAEVLAAYQARGRKVRTEVRTDLWNALLLR